MLAALAGWVASRQIIHPVYALTNVTQRMEGGDLSVRVNLPDKRPAIEFQALAQSFNGMAQRVENTISTLRAFVADASHELNTPITALQIDLEMARTTADAGERTRLLECTESQIIRLQDLVRSLLDLSRLEGKTSAPVRQQVDLTQLAQSIAEVYASRAEQAEINFELELPGDPVILPGDPAQLRTALENLLDNALKFTPPGGTVSFRLVNENAQAILSVKDTGIGIPNEDLPSLFQRFHRGHNASAYPGSGLGLTIVDQITRLHGGSVIVENTSPGVCFTLRLPLGLIHLDAKPIKASLVDLSKD